MFMEKQNVARHKQDQDHCPTGNRTQGNRMTMVTPFMKPKTEKPREQIMRFFTPDLYIRFNSPDDAVADRANDEWERSIEQYDRHLATFRDRLPSQVRKLTELPLHDAEIVTRVEEIQVGGQQALFEIPFPFAVPVWTAIAIVTVKNEGTIRSLIYSLWDRIRTHSFEEGWTFSKDREHWLYDELDVVSQRAGQLFPGGFLHRILLSTGIVLEIPFSSVIIHEFSLSKVQEEIGQ
jgi:hypothetical protein